MEGVWQEEWREKVGQTVGREVHLDQVKSFVFWVYTNKKNNRKLVTANSGNTCARDAFLLSSKAS